MPKYEVTFYTNVILGEGEQQTFRKEYDALNEHDAAVKAVNHLNTNMWLSSSVKPNHWFLTSTVTDFAIKELEEKL